LGKKRRTGTAVKDVALLTAYKLDAGPGTDSIVDIDLLFGLRAYWGPALLHVCSLLVC
jgi:hypothetical protein